MKKHHDESHENHERWLLTYADLITLLMIFFVVMYSMSKLDVAKYAALAQSLSLTMGGGKNIIGDNSPTPINTQPNLTELEQVATEQKQLSQIKEQVDKYLKYNGLENSVVTEIDERGLVVRLKDSILFDSGKAYIKDEYKEKFIKLGKILSKINRYIRVEGHTDNVPIKNSNFSSNWQLSAIRATNVVELLISQAGIPADKISALGYGEFRPVASNNTPEGRAKNRRVDIIILNSKFNQVENNKK
jgi:chemotaxis protein MotB